MNLNAKKHVSHGSNDSGVTIEPYTEPLISEPHTSEPDTSEPTISDSLIVRTVERWGCRLSDVAVVTILFPLVVLVVMGISVLANRLGDIM